MINIKDKQIIKPTLFFFPLFVALVACSDKSRKQTNEKLVPIFAEKITAITVMPENWAKRTSRIIRSPKQEAKIAEILAKMTIEKKVGQVIQGDIASVTPEEAKDYHLGSVLNGGNSAPNGDNRAPPQEWLKLADAFYQASTDTSNGGVGIPLLWGIDAQNWRNHSKRNIGSVA
jgi:beta-glucosidase